MALRGLRLVGFGPSPGRRIQVDTESLASGVDLLTRPLQRDDWLAWGGERYLHVGAGLFVIGWVQPGRRGPW